MGYRPHKKAGLLIPFNEVPHLFVVLNDPDSDDQCLLVMATSINDADTKGSSIVLESAESFDKTVAFYKKGLADNGWKIDGTISGENTTMLTAAKDTRQLVVQIGESEGKCSVRQSLGVKK